MSKEFAILCVVIIICALVVLRLVRKGAGSYADKQKSSLKTIEGMEKKIQEENLAIPFSENMLIMNHAIKELLLFAGNPEGYVVREDYEFIYFDTPRGLVKINFLLKEQHLYRNNNDTYNYELWEVHSHNAVKTEYNNMRDVIKALRTYIV